MQNLPNDLISVNPFDYQELCKIGKILGKKYNMWGKALEYFRKAFVINPDDAEIRCYLAFSLYMKGNDLSDLGRFEDALVEYNEATTIYPTAKGWESKGIALFNFL